MAEKALIDLNEARINMVTQQIRADNVDDQHLLSLLEKIPRDFFVPGSLKNLAYADLHLPIGQQQVMLKPSEEGLMLQALKIKPQDRVLEIGTGTGFVTALLANLAKEVFSLDIFDDFIKNAQTKLQKLAINNVTLLAADASQGWGIQAPYDVIIISSSLEMLPKIFLENLALQGRLFVILGKPPVMKGMLLTKTKEKNWQKEDVFETLLPQLINGPAETPFHF